MPLNVWTYDPIGRRLWFRITLDLSATNGALEGGKKVADIWMMSSTQNVMVSYGHWFQSQVTFIVILSILFCHRAVEDRWKAILYHELRVDIPWTAAALVNLCLVGRSIRSIFTSY